MAERIAELISKDLGISLKQVESVIQLVDEGNTIPFIARYRKEATGGLSDEVLRAFEERLKYVRNLEDRKAEVLRLIDEQGKLTDELKTQIESATVLQRVEDLYRPYKQKKRTRGVIAREKGLEPLAQILVRQASTFEAGGKAYSAEALLQASGGVPLMALLSVAEHFVDDEKGVQTAKEALEGALDIVAEDISDRADFREAIRKTFLERGMLVSKAVDKKVQTVYDMYYEFSEPVSKIPNHRILAIDRGESEKALKVSIDVVAEDLHEFLLKALTTESQTPAGSLYGDALKSAVTDAYKRLIAPSVENEVRNVLTDRAQEDAIKVFAKNTKPLLMAAPIKDVRVMAVDPGFRTGCKVTVLDETGKLLDYKTIYPHEPQKDTAGSKKTLRALIEKHSVDIISIGNGTASRETETLAAELIREMGRPGLSYTIVSEAGASVYSASKLATEEYPDLDVSVRGAISIGRRLQDPLAELVKIDPKSIGVGQYQHDVNQKQLTEALSNVVEDCVNSVGVDLNTATPALLKYVSGISDAVAKNIVAYRDENGKFKTRRELLKVKKLGDKAFEQSAGFMRIRDGKNPLDNTAVHPESYELANRILEALGYTAEEIRSGGLKEIDERILENFGKVDKPSTNQDAAKSRTVKDLSQLKALQAKPVQAQAQAAKPDLRKAIAQMAAALEAGEPTVRDIVVELKKPGRDPREDMPKPILRSDVLSLDDLAEGMVLTGTVRNVVDFGAFVDIGVKNDGLVHISELCDRFIKSPYGIVAVGDIVEVRVLKVDRDRQKVSLSMKKEVPKPAR